MGTSCTSILPDLRLRRAATTTSCSRVVKFDMALGGAVGGTASAMLVGVVGWEVLRVETICGGMS